MISIINHPSLSPSPWPGTGSGRRLWASRRPPEASERRLEAPASRSSSGSLLEGAEELHPLTHVVETRTGERGLRANRGGWAEGGCPPRAPAARAEGDTLADKRGQGLLHRLGVGPFERDHFNGLIRRPKRSLVEPFDELFDFLEQRLRGVNDQGVGPGV